VGVLAWLGCLFEPSIGKTAMSGNRVAWAWIKE
jgi:hypothetical protein